MPCHPRHVSEEVSDLSVWRADRNARQARLLDDAVEAAMDALYEWSRSDEKVRAIIIATSGNPRAADDDLPVAARLAHTQGGEPLDDEERRWFAVAVLRVVAPELYDQVQLGLVMSDVVEELDRAAEAGDVGAAELLSRMRDIIGRAGRPPAG